METVAMILRETISLRLALCSFTTLSFEGQNRVQPAPLVDYVRIRELCTFLCKHGLTKKIPLVYEMRRLLLRLLSINLMFKFYFTVPIS